MIERLCYTDAMLRTASKPQPDAYRQLLAAVLVRAWKDAQGRNAKERAEALAWLSGPGCENVCDWLGVDSKELQRIATH